jgi:hypothetical protein
MDVNRSSDPITAAHGRQFDAGRRTRADNDAEEIACIGYRFSDYKTRFMINRLMILNNQSPIVSASDVQSAGGCCGSDANGPGRIGIDQVTGRRPRPKGLSG